MMAVPRTSPKAAALARKQKSTMGFSDDDLGDLQTKWNGNKGGMPAPKPKMSGDVEDTTAWKDMSKRIADQNLRVKGRRYAKKMGGKV